MMILSSIFENIAWWDLINSPAGIAVATFVLVIVLNRIYGAKPAWKQFEGSLISAVKFAEKAIDDGTENKGAKRLDEALKFTIEVFKKANKGKHPTPKEEAELKEGIQIVHADLEDRGTLK